MAAPATALPLLADPVLRKRLSGKPLDPMPMTSDQFGPYMHDDTARWSRVAKQRNIPISD